MNSKINLKSFRLSFSFLLTVVLLSMYSPSVLAGGAGYQFGIFWAPTYNMPQPSSNSGGFGALGGGLTYEKFLGKTVGIEIGAFVLSELLNSNTSINISNPLSLKFHFGRHVSWAAGAYTDYQLTSVPSNINALDYGLRSTIGFDISMSKSSSLALEFGYRYGLANLSKTAGTNFTQNQAILLFGFHFGSGQ